MPNERRRKGIILKTPKEPMFVGSYVKVPIIIDPHLALTVDDLNFVVPEGPSGGQVSLSRDETYESGHPDIVLLAGYKPGNHRLQAVKRSSNKVLASADFSVTTMWANDLQGPSIWVAGDFELPGVRGAAWGGGDPNYPENYNTKPLSGTHNVAVLLVDTSSQRYKQTDVPAIRKFWEDITFSGMLIDGKTVSVAHYYREVSYNAFTITGQIFGPVSLPDAWTDYMYDTNEPKDSFYAACIAAGDPLIDYRQFQHVACVVKSVDATATTPRISVWSHGVPTLAKTEEGDLWLGTVAVPEDGIPFGLCATLAHELGHNFGWGDTYAWGGHSPQVQARELDSYDIMAHEGGLPHPVLVHRMMFGWVPNQRPIKDIVKLYNFQTTSGRVDEVVTLHPAELANPPAGQYRGIEVRIASDRNYYFEYRKSQASQIGDQHLKSDGVVLGTDVTFADDFETVSRRAPIMLLDNDVDGDGPILSSGQDYKEQDISEPNFPTDFTLTAVNTDNTKADLRVQYGVYSQPDPSIRPWDPPVYQSPDIEVRNARNDVDPKWWNVLWENHLNTVVANVTNRGGLNAPSVWVDFWAYRLYGKQPTKKSGTTDLDRP